MKLNKLLPLLLALLLVLPFAAQAATKHLVRPTEPPQYDAETLHRMQLALQSDGLSAAGGFIATMEQYEGGSNYFESTSWMLSAEGGVEPYEYVFQLMRQDDHFIDANGDPYDYSWGSKRGPANAFRFNVIASGHYLLRGFVLDAAGQQRYTEFEFDAYDDAHPTVDQVLSNVVSQCPAGDDFEKAVWLHDWITTNAEYDYSLTHRGVDGVLMRQTGVCDSYAKCYYRLLNLAGIDCQRVTGLGDGGAHAWNAIKLGGEWYWVDTTWDDPGDNGAEEDPTGINMNYMYFGLPDELFFCDHEPEDSDLHCTAYDYNYYIHTNASELEVWKKDFVAAFTDSLSEGRYTTNIPVPDSYRVDFDGGYWTIPEINDMLPFGIAAEAMRRLDWTVDDQAFSTTVDYSPANMHIEIDFTGRELTLPAELTDVETSAFEDDAGFMSVTLSDNAQTIGPSAFAGSTSLWRVIVPNASTAIDDAAFGSNSHLTFVGPAGGSAESYANAHGYHFMAE